MTKIYILEDEENLSNLVGYALTGAGFACAMFEQPRLFFKHLEIEKPALILLDLMLPEMDGIEVLRRLKKTPATAAIPVIIITAKGSEFERVKGLDLGADDYLTKPFSVLELISRIKAVLRRVAPPPATPPEKLTCGEIQVDGEKHCVTAAGVSVELTLKEFELLTCLMRDVDKVFTRDRLMLRVWGSDFVGETRTVDVHIRTLRQKLGAAGKQIMTVRGVGYKIIGNA